MSLTEWVAIVSVLIAAFGAALLIYQLMKLNQQLTLHYFCDYTKRYQEISQRFPEQVNEPTFRLDGHSDYAAIMRAMRNYFDLSFEEWFLNDLGFIDKRIWRVWQDGLKTALSKPAFQDAWGHISNDSEFGRRFESHIRQLMPRLAASTDVARKAPEIT